MVLKVSKLTKWAVILLCLAIFVPTAEASLLEIISSPQNASGGFRHNAFHTSINGGGSGSILAWYDLDTTKLNTYNPDTGDLTAAFNIYSNSTLTTLIGTTTASGNLPGANFNSNSGSLAGNISYDFNFLGANSLSNYLNGQSNVNVNYYDKFYTQTQGREVNSWEEPYLTLWGSGTVPENQYYLGTDLVLETGDTVVPEPSSMVLLTIGLLGTARLRKKK